MLDSSLVRILVKAAAAAATLLLSSMTLAGGSAENAMLIIDPTDPVSLYVGNYYKNARNIPDSNVIYISSGASSYSAFATTNQPAFSDTLTERNVRDHVDYVVLAPLSSFSMGSSGLFGAAVSKISLTAAYEIIPLVGEGAWSTGKNPYGASATSAYPSGNPALAFHSGQAYLNGSPSTDPFAGNLYIGALLGYTQGPVGNSVAQLLSMIDRSVASDGQRPSGTFYFMNNLADVNRNIRASNGSGSVPIIYNHTAAEIVALGGSASVADAIVPSPGTTSIMGIMSGFANYDLGNAGLTFVPGAFADHLTSFAGILDGTGGQTTVESWIAAGASGSAGSVEEPSPDPHKFPSADFHYYYSQGMSLGESYLRSVEDLPVEMLFYGDPLTRAFAYIPSVSATVPGGAQSGIITITASATNVKPGASIANFTLLVDGVSMGSVAPGQSFSLDTQLLDDGRHDLRVLAYDNTAVQNVGRWIGTLDTSNYGHASTLDVAPTSGTLVQPFTFSYTATGGHVLEVHLIQNGRVLAASTAASGTLTVYGQNLGAGSSTARLEVWYDDGRMGRSIPVTVNVTSAGSTTGVTPVAFSYSKYLTSPTSYVVELPASFDAAPGSVTYTLLTTPTHSTVIQAPKGPYFIVKPQPGAFGSESLQFRATGSNGASATGTVTLVYTSVTTIAAVTPSASVGPCCWHNTQPVATQIINGVNHAGMWNGTADSWTDLTPPGATGSVANATNAGQILGFANIGLGAGGYWTSGASSWVDLTPPGASSTMVAGDYVNANDNLPQGQQVGYAYINRNSRPLIWYGTAASVVDVSPPGITDSGLIGTDGQYQVGFAWIGNSLHTGFWNGTGASFVDVNPAGATESWPYAMDGAPPYESVGYASFNGVPHAGYWVSSYGGATGSWVDLHPAAAASSKALGTDANRQVGYAMFDNATHASMWDGSASTWVDLSQYLPTAFTVYTSTAVAVRHDAGGTYVLGSMQTSAGNFAVIWKSP